MPAARIRTRTSPAPGSGGATSWSSSGRPTATMRTALIARERSECPARARPLDRHSAHPGRDALRDVLGIPPDALNHRRRHRIQEVQADEIEPGLTVDDSAHLPGLAVFREDRN